MHAKGSGAYGTFTVYHDITKYTKANIFSEVGKKTDLFVRFSTVAGERGAADAEEQSRRNAIGTFQYVEQVQLSIPFMRNEIILALPLSPQHPRQPKQEDGGDGTQPEG